jgi:hypothetical protein
MRQIEAEGRDFSASMLAKPYGMRHLRPGEFATVVKSLAPKAVYCTLVCYIELILREERMGKKTASRAIPYRKALRGPERRTTVVDVNAARLRAEPS